MWCVCVCVCVCVFVCVCVIELCQCDFSGGEHTLVCSINGSQEKLCMDTDSALQPYTQYEYKVQAFNSQGMTASVWTRVTTKEAPPQDVPVPLVKVPTIYSPSYVSLTNFCVDYSSCQHTK